MSSPMSSLAALPLILGLLSSPASADETASRTAPEAPVCVRTNQVSGWTVVPDGILLRAGASQEYLVRLGSPASLLASEARIALVPNSAGRLCASSGRLIAGGRRLNVVSIERIH